MILALWIAAIVGFLVGSGGRLESGTAMTLLLIWLGCVCLIALVGGLLLVAYQRGYDAAIEAFDRGAEETRIKTAQDDALMEVIMRRPTTWSRN